MSEMSPRSNESSPSEREREYEPSLGETGSLGREYQISSLFSLQQSHFHIQTTLQGIPHFNNSTQAINHETTARQATIGVNKQALASLIWKKLVNDSYTQQSSTIDLGTNSGAEKQRIRFNTLVQNSYFTSPYMPRLARNRSI